MRYLFAYPDDTIITNKMNKTLPNGTKNSLEVFPDIPLTEFIGISVAIFACIGVVANLLVLCVLTISQRKKRFSPYRYLISHLAFSDFFCSVMLVVYVPLELEQHMWIYHTSACKFVYPIITILTNLSVGTIMIITVERYRGVVYPHRTAWKPRNLQVAIATVWFVGIFIVLPTILTIKVTRYENNFQYCNEVWDDTVFLKERAYLRKSFGIFYFVVAFCLPASSMIFMNCSILYHLKRPDLRPDNISEYQRKTNARIMRVLTAIIVTFVICVSPNKLLYFVWDLRPDLEKSFDSNARYYLRTFQILYFSRTAINPLLYCFLDTRFRKDFTNTTKAMRGLSFVDSDIGRSRARTLSVHRHSSVVLRSRATSCLSENGHPIDLNAQFFASDLINKLSTVPEGTVDTPMHDYLKNVVIGEQRMRSESTDTNDHQLCGSSSPLVNSAYMSDSSSSTTEKNTD